MSSGSKIADPTKRRIAGQTSAAARPPDALPPARRFGTFVKELPLPPAPRQACAGFARDFGYEQSPGVRDALAAIDAGMPAVLVSGRAGTGKTTLIGYLRRRPGGERLAVVAPTAVAALSAAAQTIHSFFRFPSLVLDPDALPKAMGFGKLFNHMERLVIDEISMVRADLLDAIDARLRDVRRDPRPFGGVQVIMVGDFLQLPPVVEPEARHILHGLGYRTPFAFNARVFDDSAVTLVSLEQVYRQDEQDFVDILGIVRACTDPEEAEAVAQRLNARCHRPHRPGVKPLLLTPTRAAAESYNLRGLAALRGETLVSPARIAGKLEVIRDRLPVPENLELRVGARVMAAQNDPGGRWINGSLGTVQSFAPQGVFVRFDRGSEEHLVGPAAWEKVRQVWNEREQRVESEVVGSYTQLPLNHAWAITIHKAQGLTLDDVRIDLGGGAFAPGQVYVALSRVRSLAGLSFARPLRASDIKAEPMLLAFMEWAGATGR